MLIKKLITPCSVPSKSLLLEEGQLANTLYYIKKGCLRLFFCHEGKEITFQFFFEGDFVASFDRPVQTHSQSFLFGKHRACGTYHSTETPNDVHTAMTPENGDRLPATRLPTRTESRRCLANLSNR